MNTPNKKKNKEGYYSLKGVRSGGGINYTFSYFIGAKDFKVYSIS